MLLHQTMNGLPTFLIRRLRHGARIHHTNIRLLSFTHGTHARLLQHLTDGGGLGEIQLTAQREVSRFFILKNGGIYHLLLIIRAKVIISAHKRKTFEAKLHTTPRISPIKEENP
jgi:hypothetical protein